MENKKHLEDVEELLDEINSIEPYNFYVKLLGSGKFLSRFEFHYIPCQLQAFRYSQPTDSPLFSLSFFVYPFS